MRRRNHFNSVLLFLFPFLFPGQDWSCLVAQVNNNELNAIPQIVEKKTSEKPVSRKDAEDIRNSIEDYVKGWREGDVPRLTRAFELNEGRLFWTSKTKEGEAILQSMTFAKALEKQKKSPEYGKRWEIKSLDVVEGKLAVAKVFISSSKGHYIDYLVLQKIGDDWKIITKTFAYFKNGTKQ